MYDIVIRFPSKALANKFCGQMSDGVGEGFCDFSFWHKKEGTDGTKKEHFEKVVTNAVAPNTPVYFVNSMEEF